MIDKIKRLIKAAIESFPINEKKKTEMLQRIMNEGETKEVGNDVLQ